MRSRLDPVVRLTTIAMMTISAFMVAPGAHAAADGRLTVAPRTVFNGSTASFAIDWTSTKGSGILTNVDNTRAVRVTLTGFTVHGSPTAVTSDGRAWTVSAAGNVLSASAPDASADALLKNQTLTISVTATAPVAAGTYKWKANGFSKTDFITGKSGEKSVDIKAVASSCTGHAASIAPTSVVESSAATFTVVLTNTSGSCDHNLGQTVRIGLPAGFLWGSLVSAQASGNTCGGSADGVWIGTGKDGAAFVQGQISLKPKIAASSLCPGAVLTVVFNAVAASSQGTFAWPTEMLNGGSVFPALSQPTVTTTPGCIAPSVVDEPADASATEGDEATFSVTAAGTPPLYYQWMQNGTPLTDGGRIAGALTATLSLSPVQLNDAGSTFSCSVSNECSGVRVVSREASLTVGALPTAYVRGDVAVCLGGSADIEADLTGTAPWDVTWSDGFVTNTADRLLIRTVTPAVSTTYTITALTDGAARSAVPDGLTGSATVTVNPLPTAVVSGGGVVCSGESAMIQADLTGTGPWELTWSDGIVQGGITNSPAVRAVAPASTAVYTVVALSDDNACDASAADLTGSAWVVVNPRPTAVVSGNATLCEGMSTVVQADLTGTGPWDVTWSDGVVQQGVASSPATRDVSPSASAVYRVSALSDANCTAAGAGLAGSATVTVNARPTAWVSGDATVCDGTPTIIQAVLTGTGPWSVTWSDGVTDSYVTNSVLSRGVSPSLSEIYTITELQDANCDAIEADLTGSASVTVNPRPTAVTGGDATICAGTPTAIRADLTGTGPWDVTWSDGVVQKGVANSPATRDVSPLASAVYTVTALSDASCSAIEADLTGSASVTVNPRPTAVTSGDATICDGTPTAIQADLTGTGPWDVTWSDGVVQKGVANSPATRDVTPPASAVYTVTALSDANCSAIEADLTGSASVTVKTRPTAMVTGDALVCNGCATTIRADLTGVGPWDLTWSDGVAQNGVTVSPVFRTVKPSVTTVYTVTALSDTSCIATEADLGGSATVNILGDVILALDPAASHALEISGGSVLRLPGARIAVNSTNLTALSVSGKSLIQSGQTRVAGNCVISGDSTVVPLPTTGTPVTPDPLAALPAPPVAGPVYPDGLITSSVTLSPGIYTNSVSIKTVKGATIAVTLSPGIYVFRKGLQVEKAVLQTGAGSGTMLHIESGALSIKDSVVRLTPQASGDYAGVAVFQGRTNTAKAKISGSTSEVAGTFYFPSAQVELGGKSRIRLGALIARRVTFSGGSAGGM